MIFTCYQYGLAVAAVAIFFTNVPVYLSNRLGIGVPLYWMIGLYVLSFPVLIRQIARADLLTSPVVLWGFGYLWISIAWFIPFSQSEVEWQYLRWRMLAMLNLLMFLAIFGTPKRNRLGRATIVGGVLFTAALCFYEFFVPDSFSIAVGRSAALYLDPNLTGEALVLGMIIGITVLPSWLRSPFILVTGIGVFVTFSRGGLLGWFVAVAGLTYGGRVRLKDLVRSLCVGLVLVVIVLLPRWDDLLTELERSGTLNKNVETRLAWLTNPLSSADESGSDDSSWGRRYLARLAWIKFADHPWVGNGTGSSFGTTDLSPHNLNLALIVDHGLIGAMILPTLILAMTWRLRGTNRNVAIVFACALMLFSLFSHNIISFPQHLLMFAIVSAMTSRELAPESTYKRVAETRKTGGSRDLVRA